MNYIKSFVFIVFILFGSLLLTKGFAEHSAVAYLICFLIGGFFIMNGLVRTKISFKPYFLSNWNFLSSKYIRDFNLEIPKDLAFEKLLEVIKESPFKLVYANKDRFEILAISGITWGSWGENIYLDLVNDKGNETIRFASVAFFQIYTWGKNENNYSAFLQKLDESLTI